MFRKLRPRLPMALGQIVRRLATRTHLLRALQTGFTTLKQAPSQKFTICYGSHGEFLRKVTGGGYLHPNGVKRYSQRLFLSL